MAPINKPIDKACATLHQSITKLIEQHNRYPPNNVKIEERCLFYVRHANHILRTLVAKRQSLEYAVEAFEECSESYVKEFSRDKSKERQRVILTTWFTHFLRLRDGFQLMESGEQRHVNDADKEGAGVKFKSRLSGALRRDGVTRKFKSQLGYTGFGWDEFYDDDVGVKKQLLSSLYELTGKRQKAESIISRWEENMDFHETERKLLNDRLNSIQRNFVFRMNQLLASRGETKLTLVTDDKFERMTWGLLDIKRSGNQFAILDAGGSIPIGMTLSKWKDKFVLEKPKPMQNEKLSSKAANKPSKKRLCIEDSSDEDEIPLKKPAAKQPPTKNSRSDNNSGIEVKVRDTTNLKPDNNSLSIDEIKRNLGVSVQQLEQSRIQIEDENRASAMAACDDELRELFDGMGTLEECIDQYRQLRTYKNHTTLRFSLEDLFEELREKMDRWKREGERLAFVRSKIKRLPSEKSVELYRALENSREASMQLGILFIEDIHFTLANELNELQQKRDKVEIDASLETDLAESDRTFLEAAEELFQQSLSLTEQLSSENNAKSAIEKQWEKTQHILLRARAQFNIGIAKSELSQCDGVPKGDKQQTLLAALKRFEAASKLCKLTRSNTVLIHNFRESSELSHHDQSRSWKEHAMFQKFESMELDARAQHECGVCLWKFGRFSEAEGVIHKAADTSEIFELDGCEGIDRFGIVQLLCNSQDITLSLLELSVQSLKALPVRNTSTGEKILEIARKSVQNAIKTSNDINAFAEKHDLRNTGHYQTILRNVMGKESLEAEENAITEFWRKRMNSTSERLNDNLLRKDKTAHELHRGELHLDFQGVSLLPGRRKILISNDHTTSRRRRTAKGSSNNKKAATDHFHSEFVDFTEGVGGSSRDDNREAMQYMPWGDEILNEEDFNKYPACCPPLPTDMPLDIRHLLEEKLEHILPSV